MDELFTIIGRLYIDLVQSQKLIENLQKRLKDKEEELSTLENSLGSKDNNWVNLTMKQYPVL